VRFYVGATFARYEEVREVVDVLEAAGHSCTHDWTRTAEFDQDGHPRGDGYDASPAVLRASAREDLRGVRQADACLFLGQEASAGWPTEFGAALAYGTARVVVVAPWRGSCFWHLPQVVVVASLAEALEVLGREP
jgi:hypothetical protein